MPDLSEMGLLSLFNYLLCVIDVFTKHACARPWKSKISEKPKTCKP